METAGKAIAERRMHCKSALSTRSSAAIIGGNDDLVIEILLFLPAKSLIRLKVVSKQWRSLISAPSFCRLHHLRRRPTPPHSFILGRNPSEFFICDPTSKKLVPFSFPYPGVKIMQSCNGLLLLESRTSPHSTRQFYVFNPTTRQSRNLLISQPFCGLSLAFDPGKSQYYKVVRTPGFLKQDNSCIEVYDSETHRWEKLCVLPPKHRNSLFRQGVYWRGAIYFIRSRESNTFRFFLEDGFHSVPQPQRVHSHGGRKSYVMESNGYLHYLVLSLKPRKNHVSVLEMNEDASDWFTKLCIDLNPVSAEFAASNGTSIELLGLTRAEKEEDSMLLFHVPRKIMIYKFGMEIFEVLVDFTRDDDYLEGLLQFDFRDAHTFIHSLTPV